MHVSGHCGIPKFKYGFPEITIIPKDTNLGDFLDFMILGSPHDLL